VNLQYECKEMHIGNKNPRNGDKNNLVEKTSLEKNRDEHVDSDLKFDPQVEFQCEKAKTILGISSFTLLQLRHTLHEAAAQGLIISYPGIWSNCYLSKIKEISYTPRR
jgi:hypothetical protein